ncbi:MAG TPA: type II secretion system F family protein [Actinomycetota bacterium]|nr:type II secretion system F family protein [Actinomycetota bacterium]
MNIVLAALFVILGGGMVAYGISLRGNARRQKLRELLDAEMVEPSRSPEALAELIERAGAYAERAFGKTSWAERVRVSLEQAGWSLKAGEFGAILAISTIGTVALVAAVTRSFAGALVAAVAVPTVAVFWLNSKGRRRLAKMEDQLPSVLQLIAGSLDSGASLLLALELAGAEGNPPLAPELTRVVAETRVGRPLIESLEAMAARIGSRDIAWTVEAIRIQQLTGGKLADTLRVLADFMRTRLEVRGEVRALSAEARISGKVLTGLPLVIGTILFLFRREYLEPLIETGGGRIMLFIAAGGIVVGTLWMRRLVRVEV